MDPQLKVELDGAVFRCVPRLVELVLPDSALPLAASKLLLSLSSGPNPHYDSKTKQWHDCPKLDEPSIRGDKETELSRFLNRLGTAMEDACRKHGAGHKLSLTRKWTAKYAGKPVPGATSRKPDILLFDTDDTLASDDSWDTALAHCELKSKLADATAAETQLTNGAYLIFKSQDDRRFSLGLSMCAATISLLLYDRSGLVSSDRVDIHAEPETFIRILAGLMLADFSTFGYDSTVERRDGEQYIEAGGKTYQLIDTVFISDVIRGRGTVCWRARCNGQDYVIKDMWADESRDHSEADILELVSDVPGLPHVVWHGDVHADGVKDSTARWRSTIDKEKLQHLEKRVHRRLIMTPFAQPIHFFSCKRELLSMLIDIIRAHRRLVKKGILHRDISCRNMLRAKRYPPAKKPQTVTPSSASSGTAPTGDVSESSTASAPTNNSDDDVDIPPPGTLHRGLLIDLDYASVSKNKDRTLAIGHRTGTLPFMAIDILGSGYECVHEPKHDLESVFYVLVWLCIHYDGPNNSERRNFSAYDTILKVWLTGEPQVIGYCKHSIMSRAKEFEVKILSLFTPYFEELKPCVSELRNAIFSGTAITHEAMLTILQDAFDALPDIETWSPESSSKGRRQTRSSSKRKRALALEADIPEEEEEEVEEEVEDEDEDEDKDEDETRQGVEEQEGRKGKARQTMRPFTSCPAPMSPPKPSKRVRSE